MYVVFLVAALVLPFAEGQSLRLVWSYPTAQPCNAPALYRRQSMWTWLFIACEDGSLSALNSSTSTVAWSVQLKGSVVTDPAVDESGNVYVATAGGSVYKIDGLNSGAILWYFDCGRGIQQAQALSFGSGVVVVGDEIGNTHIISTSTGAGLDTATGSTISDPTPIVYESIIAHSDKEQVWIDSSSSPFGLNAKFTQGSGKFHRCVGIGSNLACPNDDGHVYIFDFTSGNGVGTIAATTALPVVYSYGLIFVVQTSGALSAYDGVSYTLQWTSNSSSFVSPPASSQAHPAVPIVYVGTSHGVDAVNVTSGETVSRFKTNTAVTRTPGVQFGSGDVFITTQEGVFRLTPVE